MSITVDGVKFNNKPKNRRLLFIILGVFEFILTVFLVITLAANVLMPEKAMAVEGVSNILSYQGRLTDASGNALGGTGTNYCFRFSIYDDAAVGGTDNDLWPSGTPSDNIVNVVNGVFNVGIGEVDNLGTFNFATNTTVYLNVEAATYSGGVCGSYDNLAPRQRIDAVAYARVAHDLYGGQVRIGSGTEGGSPKLLYLDVKNISDTIGGACSINGTIWYNSNNTRALVCNDGVIMAFGSPATTTIVAVKEQGATSAISSGTVNLSGADNITISQDGQTLKFYGAAGGTSGGISGIGASNATATSGTVVFSNSNNVSFGMDGNTITASAGVAGGGIAGIGASNTIFTNGTVVFSGGNNITVGTDDQKIIISAANQSVQTQNLHNVTLGGNTLGAMAQISSGTMTLAGGDNVTLSQDGNAITIIGASGGGGNYAGINGAITGGSLTVNTSGVSINLPDYLTTAMASNAGVRWASNDSQLRFASGDSQLRFTSNDLQLQFTSGMSNYQTAGNYLTTAMASNAGSNFVGLNSAMTGGSLTANSSGISINLPAYLTTAAQSTQTAQVLGSYGNISLVGASGGSLSTNASTISIGIATSYLTSFQQTSGMSAYLTTAAQSTQTAQVLGSYGNINLVGASGGSLSTNASTISIGIATSYLTSFQQTSGMGAYQATSNMSNYLTTAMASGAGSNFVNTSAGLNLTNISATLASNSLSLSVGNYLTTAAQSTQTAQVLGSFGNISLVGASGGSLSTNASTISIGIATSYLTSFQQTSGMGAYQATSNMSNYLTTAAQSTQTAQVLGSFGNISLVGASGGSLSTNASTISIGIATSYLTSFQQTSGMGAYQATSIGNVGGIAGSAASTVTGGTVVFSNLNNVSFGLNVSTMTASVPAGATATGNLGGLAVSNVASTFTSGTVQFSGSNLISIGTAAGPAIVISNLLSSATTVSAVASANAVGAMASRFALEGHQHAGVAAMGVSGAASTAGNTQTTFGSWYFMPGGNITLSQVTGAGGVHTLSIQGGGGGGGFGVSNIGNFLGNTGTKDLGTFVLSGQANITLSQITDVGGVHTIGISAPNPGGGGGVTLSRWEIPDAGMLTGTATSSHAANSWWFNPFYLQQPLSISNIWVMKSLNVSTVISSNSSGRQSYSYSHGVTIFTRQDWAANSTRLSYLTTGSFGLSFSRSHTGSSNSISAAWVTNSVGGTSSFSTSSNASNWAQFFTGIRQFAIPMVTSFSAGEYFIAHRHSSTTATANSNATIWFISNVHIAPQSVAFRRMGNSVANMTLSSAMPGGIGFGIASAVTTNNTMPASVISAGTQQYWYANLVNLSIT